MQRLEYLLTGDRFYYIVAAAWLLVVLATIYIVGA